MIFGLCRSTTTTTFISTAPTPGTGVQFRERRIIPLGLDTSILGNALLQLLDKRINFFSRHIGHDDNMSNIFLTSKLPSSRDMEPG
jgi:hypothetical protein